MVSKAAGVPYVEEVIVEEGGAKSVEDASSGVVVDEHENGGELVVAEILEELVGVEEVEASVGRLKPSLDRVCGGGDVVGDELPRCRAGGSSADVGADAVVWARRGDAGSLVSSRCRR